MSPTTSAIRYDLYQRFSRRNKVIGVLRIAVPVLGALLLAIPVLQVAYSAISDVIPIEGIRLENDTLVIDAPRFEGRTATGTVYAMDAERAETRIGNLDIADLYGLTVDIEGDGGYEARAEFSSAQWTMSREILTSNEDVHVADSTGARGVLAGMEVDWPAQVITSDGPVRFSFDNGAELDAQTMVHDMEAAWWRFSNVSLDMVPQPDEGRERDPYALEVPDAQ